MNISERGPCKSAFEVSHEKGHQLFLFIEIPSRNFKGSYNQPGKLNFGMQPYFDPTIRNGMMQHLLTTCNLIMFYLAGGN
jgi:hypothetical protein